MIKAVMSLVRAALENPVGSLIALSFVVMALVLGIERIEQGPPALLWVSRHHRSIALVKQVLCMTAIPGFLVLMFWNFKAKAKSPTDPS